MAIERACPKCSGTTTKKTGYCRACSTEYVRERRRAGQFKPITDAARRANSARSYARVYLKRGLIEPGVCEVPGCTAPPRMHHDDFEKPLSVRWRCYAHRIRRGRRYDAPDRTLEQEPVCSQNSL